MTAAVVYCEPSLSIAATAHSEELLSTTSSLR
jgi:hypothetical protein